MIGIIKLSIVAKFLISILSDSLFSKDGERCSVVNVRAWTLDLVFGKTPSNKHAHILFSLPLLGHSCNTKQ